MFQGNGYATMLFTVMVTHQQWSVDEHQVVLTVHILCLVDMPVIKWQCYVVIILRYVKHVHQHSQCQLVIYH